MIKKKIYELFGYLLEDYKESKDDLENDTLSTILAKSLKVELLSIVLKGIMKLNKSDNNKKINEIKIKNGFEHQTIIKKIKIHKQTS